MIPSADLDVMYELFTIAATVGGVTANVHFRQGDADTLGGTRIAREYRMRYRLASFSVSRGTTVTIAGIGYRVLEVRQLDSGDEAEARMERV